GEDYPLAQIRHMQTTTRCVEFQENVIPGKRKAGGGLELSVELRNKRRMRPEQGGPHTLRLGNSHEPTITACVRAHTCSSVHTHTLFPRLIGPAMTNLLHISSSPRGEQSESLALASTFLKTLADVDPNLSVDHWDLWDGSLPSFG